MARIGTKRKRHSPDEVDRVYRELRKKFSERGSGTLRRVEKALGVRSNYFSYHQRSHTLDYGALFTTLRELDVEPADFFCELYGRPNDEAPGPDPATSEAPRGPRRQAIGGLPPDVPVRAFGPEDPELAAALEPWLVEMDEMRYDDCEAALSRLREKAGEIPVDAGARWLSVVASCLRMAGDLGEAELCFQAALEIAPRQGVEANVLQRGSYIVRDRGEFEEALHMSERAGGIFARIGDWESLGKTMVDQGQFLDLLGRRPAAIRCVREAMDLVPERSTRYWQAIHQYLALWLQGDGSLNESHAHAVEAEALAADRQQKAGVLWLRAGILERMGRHGEAADAYEATLALIPGQPFEGLLTTAHLVRARALEGSPEDAVRAARTAVESMGACGKNCLAQALVLEMYRLTARECRQAAKLDALIEAAEKLKPRAGEQRRLGSRLRRARKRENLTRRRVAKIMGVAESSLLNIERGRMPGRSYEERIATWLVSVSPESQLAASVLR